MKDFGIEILDEIIENSAAGITAYESPDYVQNRKKASSYDFLSNRYGCDRITDHRTKSRCMLRGKLLELKKKLDTAKDNESKQKIMIQIKKWTDHYRSEMNKSRFRKESIEITEQPKRPINILRDKEKRGRIISKEGYLTVKKEISDEMAESQKYVGNYCKDPRGGYEYPCRNRVFMRSMRKIQNLKRECVRLKYHKQRCEKACDSALQFFTKRLKKEEE